MATEEQPVVQTEESKPEEETVVESSEKKVQNKYLGMLIKARDFLAKPQVLSGITIVILLVFLTVFLVQTREVLKANELMHTEHHEMEETLKKEIYGNVNRRDEEMFEMIEKRNQEVVSNTEDIAALYKKLSEAQGEIASLIQSKEEAEQVEQERLAEEASAASEEEPVKKRSKLNPINWFRR